MIQGASCSNGKHRQWFSGSFIIIRFVLRHEADRFGQILPFTLITPLTYVCFFLCLAERDRSQSVSRSSWCLFVVVEQVSPSVAPRRFGCTLHDPLSRQLRDGSHPEGTKKRQTSDYTQQAPSHVSREMAEVAAHAQKLTLKELFQAAQQDDFKAVDDYLQVVLHEEHEAACKSDNTTGVMMLVEPKTRNTLLHYACDNGNLDACKYLLMYEGMAAAFLNEPNSFGHTPLFYAANSGKLPLVKWLISNGADIDIDYSDRPNVAPRDDDHGIFTPLQIASFHGHEEVVNFLVECNAELSGTRRNGKSALHFASAQNHKRIVKILLEAGADAHATDCDGKSPVDVAHSSILSLLLPNEHGGVEIDDGDDIEAHDDAADDEDDEDDGFSSSGNARVAIQAIRSSFGADISREFRDKSWKARVKSINNAALCFQHVTGAKNAFKLFLGACQMMVAALQDPVSQVASSCCTTLLKAAFNAVMSESEFHGPEFHRRHPEIQQIATGLLNRGAGSNEKDSSEAVASLLFLICKSTEVTRYLTSQISQIMLCGTVTPSASISMTPSKNAESSVLGGAVPWRLQLVSIKILNTIASQYRLDQASSGLSFPDAIKISMHSLDNSSVHVRTASIDLLVQCLLIRCEESGNCYIEKYRLLHFPNVVSLHILQK